ncbi:DUF1272 domain-containing protein [Neptunomonas sp.]|nr:DUF1272 domain-containing protein [Neptunomonas sp.]
MPLHSTQACICTYECTFCRSCVEELSFKLLLFISGV